MFKLVGVRKITDRVTIFHQHPQDMGIVKTKIIEVLRMPVNSVVNRVPMVAPDQIRHLPVLAVVADRFQKLAERLFSRITTENKVDTVVIPNQLLTVIGSGKSADDDRDLGVLALEKCGQTQAAIDMREALQKTEGNCTFLCRAQKERACLISWDMSLSPISTPSTVM